MDEKTLHQLLRDVRARRLTESAAIERLRNLPFEDLGFAKVDHHRSLRRGFAEVVFGRGKTPDQVAGIVRSMLARRNGRHNILVTRADKRIHAAVRRLAPSARFHPLSGAILVQRDRVVRGKGTILVVSVGTGDIPVAEEALVAARSLGNRAEAIYDVGVAGLHRLLRHRVQLSSARVIICVAGMEGALPMRRRRARFRSCHRCAHQRRLWREFRRCRRSARHAQ